MGRNNSRSSKEACKLNFGKFFYFDKSFFGFELKDSSDYRAAIIASKKLPEIFEIVVYERAVSKDLFFLKVKTDRFSEKEEES